MENKETVNIAAGAETTSTVKVVAAEKTTGTAKAAEESKRIRHIALIVCIFFVAALLPADISHGASSNANKAGASTLANKGGASTLENKRIFIAGDSLQNKGRYNRYGAFIQRACEDMGAEKIKNVAKSDACLANVKNGASPNVYKQVMNQGKRIGNYDVYFIAAGTNDYGFSYGKADIPKTTKALTSVIDTIHKANPEGKIVVVTPVYSFRFGGKRVDCETMKNKYGHTLAQYRNAIRKTASKEKYRDYVMVVNGKTLAKKNIMKSKKNTWDYLHPKAAVAKKVLAPNLIKKLKASDYLSE